MNYYHKKRDIRIQNALPLLDDNIRKKRVRSMSDISKYTLTIIIFYFLLVLNSFIFAKQSFQRNETNKTQTSSLNESSTVLDYYFYSYDVIDHNTLRIKFDLTRTILFQQSQILYDAYLYVSKIPSPNYKINIGPFSGLYEKDIHGTITDHFTFCLVLIPNPHQKKFNITSKKNRTEPTIYDDLFTLSYQKQQQHIVHYCTKMGPIEERHRHPKKQGSQGDHILLLLQIMMIVIFLVVLQIVHSIRNQKYKEWYFRLHHENLSRKDYANMSKDALELLRFTTINNEESQDEIDEHEENTLVLSHRRIPTSTKKRQRSRSPSPSPTINQIDIIPNNASVEHILDNKPWLQIPHGNQ